MCLQACHLITEMSVSCLINNNANRLKIVIFFFVSLSILKFPWYKTVLANFLLKRTLQCSGPISVFHLLRNTRNSH
jgi:hypothetical protein